MYQLLSLEGCQTLGWQLKRQEEEEEVWTGLEHQQQQQWVQKYR
jgi:hypothetical protein